jgi:hypothetical protein
VSCSQSTNCCVLFPVHNLLRPVLSHKLLRHVLSHKLMRSVLSHKLLRPVLSHKLMCSVLSPQAAASCSQPQTAVSCSQSTKCCVLFPVHKLLRPVLSHKLMWSVPSPLTASPFFSATNCNVQFSATKHFSGSQSTNCCVLFSVATSEFCFTESNMCSCWLLSFFLYNRFLVVSLYRGDS